MTALDIFYLFPLIGIPAFIIGAVLYIAFTLRGWSGIYGLIICAWFSLGVIHFANANNIATRKEIVTPIKVKLVINCLPERAADWCATYGACCGTIAPASGEEE